MLIGYARVSTTEQSLDVQLDQLCKAGAEKIFKEKASGADSDRVQLAAMIEFAREGDCIIATKLDRIARSTLHLLSLIEQMQKKGIHFRSLDIALDTATPTGKLMLTMLAGIATFERDRMLERQAEGIAKAKGQGKYQGRKPTARAQSSKVLELAAQGKKRECIAQECGISTASVYRILSSGGHQKISEVR